jgi:hypothetical protein
MCQMSYGLHIGYGPLSFRLSAQDHRVEEPSQSKSHDSPEEGWEKHMRCLYICVDMHMHDTSPID